jgi:hypothetical protein
MIPMECPSCGRQGEVPLDRLNSKLTCKKCGTVFHMDDTGHILLGEPGSGKAKRVEEKSGPVEMDFGKVLRELPKPVLYGVPGVAAALLVGIVAFQVIGSLGLSKELAPRAAHVGELFADLQLAGIRDLTTPESIPQIEAWYNRVRPKLNFDGPQVAPDDVTSLAQVFQENESTALTFTALHVARPPKPAVKDGPQDDLTIELAWVWSGGRWMIDGKETLSAATRSTRRR